MTFLSIENKYKIILASQSPRRQNLLKELKLNFEIKIKEIEEVYPPELKKEEIPVYLAELKALAFNNDLQNNELVITADTIVWVNNSVLGKPTSYQNAFSMLETLSNNKHTVYTGVCLKTKNTAKTFWASTDVYFRKLEKQEIEYYLEHYKPYDKAGSYGIQEWIGYIGIEKIEGSYFNVMGLPIQKLYDELKKFNT
ncbi:MAG: Maf-like protein [Salinivirgaceae bacterium]|jgi:septum formation protein|nr:Maf-like protein [Salinivirgaceae bacterium]